MINYENRMNDPEYVAFLTKMGAKKKLTPVEVEDEYGDMPWELYEEKVQGTMTEAEAKDMMQGEDDLWTDNGQSFPNHRKR